MDFIHISTIGFHLHNYRPIYLQDKTVFETSTNIIIQGTHRWSNTKNGIDGNQSMNKKNTNVHLRETKSSKCIECSRYLIVRHHLAHFRWGHSSQLVNILKELQEKSKKKKRKHLLSVVYTHVEGLLHRYNVSQGIECGRGQRYLRTGYQHSQQLLNISQRKLCTHTQLKVVS